MGFPPLEGVWMPLSPWLECRKQSPPSSEGWLLLPMMHHRNTHESQWSGDSSNSVFPFMVSGCSSLGRSPTVLATELGHQVHLSVVCHNCAVNKWGWDHYSHYNLMSVITAPSQDWWGRSPFLLESGPKVTIPHWDWWWSLLLLRICQWDHCTMITSLATHTSSEWTLDEITIPSQGSLDVEWDCFCLWDYSQSTTSLDLSRWLLMTLQPLLDFGSLGVWRHCHPAPQIVSSITVKVTEEKQPFPEVESPLLLMWNWLKWCDCDLDAVWDLTEWRSSPNPQCHQEPPHSNQSTQPSNTVPHHSNKCLLIPTKIGGSKSLGYTAYAVRSQWRKRVKTQ